MTPGLRRILLILFFLMFTIHFLQNVLFYRWVTTNKISDELTYLQKMECKIDFTVF